MPVKRKQCGNNGPRPNLCNNSLKANQKPIENDSKN